MICVTFFVMLGLFFFAIGFLVAGFLLGTAYYDIQLRVSCLNEAIRLVKRGRKK